MTPIAPFRDWIAETAKRLWSSVRERAKWHNYDPEDAVRFYALRLREAGMIKSSPNKILADGTDWRFWNELKRELKS